MDDPTRKFDAGRRAFLESLIRDDYARCHPGETLDDLIYRARFSREDQGLLRDWLMFAVTREKEHQVEKAASSRVFHQAA
ncbi:hypothetical protein [Chelativorans sp. AA-79]|uniref:hypothetical protein n=1 Tax=Chelativorans sp. AA-79 TaxID=3028735 RepID=UPI0023F84751|nr:hypothetical protein [Chelativorans sp. AA-79]WEX08598.1 hypothetical protein PVE73_21420 [Chelativorans sp. AA-79]